MTDRDIIALMVKLEQCRTGLTRACVQVLKRLEIHNRDEASIDQLNDALRLWGDRSVMFPMQAAARSLPDSKSPPDAQLSPPEKPE